MGLQPCCLHHVMVSCAWQMMSLAPAALANRKAVLSTTLSTILTLAVGDVMVRRQLPAVSRAHSSLGTANIMTITVMAMVMVDSGSVTGVMMVIITANMIITSAAVMLAATMCALFNDCSDGVVCVC